MDFEEFTSGYPEFSRDFDIFPENSCIQDHRGDDLSLLHTNEGNLIENNETQLYFENNKRTKVQRSSPSTDKLRNGSDVLSQAVSAAGIQQHQQLSNAAGEIELTPQTEWKEEDFDEILKRNFGDEQINNLADFDLTEIDFSDFLGAEKEKKIDEFDNEKVDIHQNPTFANAEDESNRPGPSRPQQGPKQTLISNTIEAQPEATHLESILDNTDGGYIDTEDIVYVEEPLKKGELITIQDPMASMKSYFDVEPAVLSSFLNKHGKPVSGPLPKTKEQIQTLVARFCDVKELEYLNKDDAEAIVNSGFVEIKTIPIKNCKEHGKFQCQFCPITQGHERGFDRKEDIKRHNHQHLNYARFSCKYCDYHNSRTDHMKNHMGKCHPQKARSDFNRSDHRGALKPY